MTRQKPPTYPLILLALSLIGLSLLPLIITTPSTSIIQIPLRTQLIGSLFLILCILGILAAIFPKQCQNMGFRRTVSDPLQDQVESEDPAQPPTRQGHHPPCDHFVSHTLHINNKVYCAGCTGLTIGALFGIGSSFSYFFLGVFVGEPVLGFWIGICCVTLGLLQHSIYTIFKIHSGYFRTLLNVLFVGGATVLLISVDRILQSLEVDLYLFVLILFWIYTRIHLSRRSHVHVCNVCGLEPCQFM